LSSNILDFYAYIAFVMVVLIFFVLFAVSGEKINYKIKSEAGYSDTNLVLLNILRTPVSSSDNVADLVVAAADKADFSDVARRMNPILEEHFAKNFNNCEWSLEISRGQNTLYKTKTKDCAYSAVYNRILLPNLNPKAQNIEVVLILCESTVAGGDKGALGTELSSQPCAYKN
jgi:hypothetical protein